MEFKDMKFGEILALKYNFDFEVINDALSLQISNDKYKDLKLGEILKEQNKIIRVGSLKSGHWEIKE